MRTRRKRNTNQHGNAHDQTPARHAGPPPKPINRPHLHNRHGNLDGHFRGARHQRQPVLQAEGLEQRGQVVLDGCSAAHLRHELQEERAPQPGEQTGVAEEREGQ